MEGAQSTPVWKSKFYGAFVLHRFIPDTLVDFHTVIDNPDYKGPWELWTVNGGSIFDNILVTDDKKYADKMAEKTWKKIKGEEGAGEKEAKEAWKKENEPEEEEPEEDEDDDDEDDDEEEEHDEL